MQGEPWEELRCGNCRRKLGVGTCLRLAIKCPRCGALNHYSAASAPTPARHGTPDNRSFHDSDQSVQKP